MRALIDGDVILYRACFATEYSTYSHPAVGVIRHKKDMLSVLLNNYDEDDEDASIDLIEKHQVTEPISHTFNCIDTSIDAIVRKLGVVEYTIFLEGAGDKFRKQVDYPTKYKGNRPPKPSNFQSAKDYLVNRKNTKVVTGPYEVDDMLGIEATMYPNKSIICSIDKDLRMIPGWHYHIEHQTLEQVSEQEAMDNFWIQMLMGDRVDNIIGIYNVGIKKATKLIKETPPQDRKRLVLELYEKEFGPDEFYKMYEANNKLLWILRHPLGMEGNGSKHNPIT